MHSPLPSALVPPNEAKRLAALHRYQLLDARSEYLLDEVVRLAARLFGVSTAMLSIVEENTVLLKAPYNLPASVERVPRQQTLCAATILQEATVVYENLAEASVPCIDFSLLQALGLRFYAGHNLRAPDGYAIGTLCLFDGAPRPFEAEERTLLGVLAGVVMRLLELRLTLGPQLDNTFILWEPVYRAIGGELNQLLALAGDEGGPGPLITPALTAEARAIAALIDGFVTATLQQV